MDSKLDSKREQDKTQTVKQETHPEASAQQAMGSVDGMLDVTQSHAFLNNNYESVSQSNATNKNINFQQMTTVLRSSKQSQLEVSKTQSNPMMPSLMIQQNSKDLDPADALYQQKFMRNCCRNQDGHPNLHQKGCINYTHMVKFDPKSFKNTKRAQKLKIEEFQHRQFIPKVFGQNAKQQKKFSSTLYSVTSQSGAEDYYSFERAISNLESGLMVGGTQQRATQDSRKSSCRNNSAINKRSRFLKDKAKGKKSRQKSSNEYYKQKGDQDCATIHEDLQNDISNIQVSHQFEPDRTAPNQFYTSDRLNQASNFPEAHQFTAIQPNTSIIDYYTNIQMQRDQQKQGRTDNNSTTSNSFHNHNMNYLNEHEMAQLRASSKTSGANQVDVYQQPPLQQYGRGSTDSLERRMYHQQFGLLNDHNLLKNTHEGIVEVIEVPGAQSMVIDKMNSKLKLCNETNTNSSQVMDEHKFGQQLQLMVAQLKNFGTSELKEMQKHYQQLLEQKEKEVGQIAYENADDSKERILRHTESLGSRIIGGQLDQLDIKNALNLINQQLVIKESRRMNIINANMEGKEIGEQEYYDPKELELHDLKQGLQESLNIQNSVVHDGISGNVMQQKSSNNQQITYGTGWRPGQMMKTSIQNSQSINKIEHGEMKNKYNELAMSSDRALIGQKGLAQSKKQQSPGSKNKISSQAGILSQQIQATENQGQLENLSIIGHEIFGHPKSRIQPLKVVVNSTAKMNVEPSRQSQQSDPNTQKDTATMRQASNIKIDENIKSGQFSQINLLSDRSKHRIGTLLQPRSKANPDLRNLADSENDLMNFNVEKELLELLHKQMNDERNESYKYNLDKSYHYSREIETKSRSQPANAEARLNFASVNKKGDMEIRPVKINRKREKPQQLQLNSKSKSKSATNVAMLGASNILAVRQLNPSLKALDEHHNQKVVKSNKEKRSRQSQISRGLTIAKVPKADAASPEYSRSRRSDNNRQHALGYTLQQAYDETSQSQNIQSRTHHVKHLVVPMTKEEMDVTPTGLFNSNNIYTDYTEAPAAKVKVITGINRTTSNYSNSQNTGESPNGTHLGHRMAQAAEEQDARDHNIHQEDQGGSSAPESTLRRRQYSPESKKYGLLSLVPLAREDSGSPNKYDTVGRRLMNEPSVEELDFLRASSAIKEHSERQQVLSYNSKKQSSGVSSPARFIQLLKNTDSRSSQNEEEQEQAQLPLTMIQNNYDREADNEEEGDHDQTHKHVARYSISQRDKKNDSNKKSEVERPQVVTEKNSEQGKCLSGGMSSSKNIKTRSRGKSVLSISATNEPMIEAIKIRNKDGDGGSSANHSQQDKAFPLASVGSVSDVLINAKSMIKSKTNIILSNSKNSRTRSQGNSSKAGKASMAIGNEKAPSALQSPLGQPAELRRNQMNVHENDEDEDPESIEQPVSSSRDKELQRPSGGDHQMQIGVFQANLMASDPTKSQPSKSQEMTQQRRPISSEIASGSRTQQRYTKTPLDGIDEGLALQTLHWVDSNMAQRENQSKATISDSQPALQHGKSAEAAAQEMMLTSNHLQMVYSQRGDILAQMPRTNTQYQNTEFVKDEREAAHRFTTNDKLANSHYFQSNQTLNGTLSPPGNVRGSAHRHTTNTMRSMSFMPLRKSGSRGGQNSHSMIKIQSSQRGEEFSVAEMSAQVMLDLNDINTEASQQLNASYGAGTQLGMNTPQVLTRFMSSEAMQRANMQSSGHSPEESLANIDLEVVIREAIRQQEEKQQQTMSHLEQVDIIQYVMQNKEAILNQAVAPPPKNEYYAKQLVENPQAQSKKNYRAFRKQSDNDVYLRHIQNDKQFHLQKQDFELRGKKLHTIKHNMIQQEIFRYIWQQIEIAHKQALEAQKKGHSISVNVHAPNLIDGFQRYLLPSMSSRQQLPSASRIQSTRRTVRLNQKQQLLNENYMPEPTQAAAINRIFSQAYREDSQSLAENVQALCQTMEGEEGPMAPSPRSRDGETATLMELRQASALALGKHSKATDHCPSFKNQPDRQMDSGRSCSSKGGEFQASASRSARNTAAYVGITEVKARTSGQKTKNANEKQQEHGAQSQPWTQKANRLPSVDQSPVAAEQSAKKGVTSQQMASSVISHSGYGIGGVYGLSDNREIKSPRMQHLNLVNADDVVNMTEGAGQQLNQQVLKPEAQGRIISTSNIKDSQLATSGINLVESREDELSYFQTDEINGSQSNRKRAIELVEYSRISEADEGGHMIFNATTDMMMLAEAVDHPVAENMADWALANSRTDGQGNQIRVDHVLPVQVVSSPREPGQKAGNRWQNRQQISEIRTRNAQLKQPTTEPSIFGAAAAQIHKSEKYLNEARREITQPYSIRMQTGEMHDTRVAQAIYSSTLEHPVAAQRLKSSKEATQSPKRTTLNESDQLMSNQFITRPVMTGSPIAAYGGHHSNARNPQGFGSYYSATGRTQEQLGLPIETVDVSKNQVKAASPYSSRHDRPSAIFTANQTLKTLPRNLSDDTTDMHVAKARQIAADRGGSHEGLADLDELAKPRAFRARVDLRDGQGQNEMDENRLSSAGDATLIELSKSKMLDDIGKSFQSVKFTNTAKNISNNFRMSKGMPLDSRINKNQATANIEHGGSTANIRVSVSKMTANPTFEGRTESREDARMREMSRQDARIGHDPESRASMQDALTAQELHERGVLVGNIVQQYKKPPAGAGTRQQPSDMAASFDNLQSKPMRTGVTLLKAQLQKQEGWRQSKYPEEKTSSGLADGDVVYGQKSMASLTKSKKVADINKKQYLGSQDLFRSSAGESLAGRLQGESGNIFDERKSQASLKMNKTSRLNQRLMSGPGGQAQNMIGSVANYHSQQLQDSKVLPAQRQVNYLVNNPTAHEISNSRLIENSKVLKTNAKIQENGRNHTSRPDATIEKGCLKSSYGYQQKRGKPGEFKTGGLVATTRDGRKVLDEISCVEEILEATERYQGQSQKRIQSAGHTHASTGIRDSFGGADLVQNIYEASNVGDFLIAQNLQREIDKDIQFSSQKDKQEVYDRARPKTAKVGGFVNNLKQQSSNFMHLENGDKGSRVGVVQRPARIESAHNAVTRGLHPNRTNIEIAQQQQSQNLFQSSQYNDSNYPVRKASVPSHFRKEQALESSGQGHTVGILSKVSGAPSNGTHLGNGLLINSSQSGQMFYKQYYPHDSEKNSNADLIEHGLAGMHSMNTMHVSDQYRAAQQAELQRYQHSQQMSSQQAYSTAKLQNLAFMQNVGTAQHSVVSRGGSNADLLRGEHAHRYQTQPELTKTGPLRQVLLGHGAQGAVSPISELSGLGSERSLPHQRALRGSANMRRPVTAKQRGLPTASNRAGKGLKKGKVFKDQHFEARMRNGANGYVL